MDVASKQQKTLKNVLYYGLPVLAILMIAVAGFCSRAVTRS